MKETIKLNLVDEKNNNILCSIDASLYWKNEDDENPDLYFHHVMTSNECTNPFDVLTGWQEMEEKHNQEWRTLCDMIYNDENLLCNFWYEDGMDEEINYYI